jgi:hypothetical protein
MNACPQCASSNVKHIRARHRYRCFDCGWWSTLSASPSAPAPDLTELLDDDGVWVDTGIPSRTSPSSR